MASTMEDLTQLAELIRRRNALGKDITQIIGRPSLIGHLGEYIAARVFDITLEESAINKGFDGRFCKGPLVGKSVNVKWYAKKDSWTFALMRSPTSIWSSPVHKPEF